MNPLLILSHYQKFQKSCCRIFSEILMNQLSLLQSTTEGPCLELPEILQQFQQTESSLRLSQEEEVVQQVLLGVRDFCSLLWLLHARDKLSYNLRSREKYLNDVNYQDYLRVSFCPRLIYRQSVGDESLFANNELYSGVAMFSHMVKTHYFFLKYSYLLLSMNCIFLYCCA